MSVARTVDELRTAIQTFVEPEDDGLIEVWDRQMVFRLDRPEKAVWERRGAEAPPPETFLLMIRRGRDPVSEMIWRPNPALPIEKCPVVGISEEGDTTVIANCFDDWLDALLYTGGSIGGGAEEDLEAAREDAAREAVRLGDQVADEMDRDLPDLEALGDRWEQAQDSWSDVWADAVEGLE